MRQIETEPNYNNNLAYRPIRSTIKTLPEPKSQVPGLCTSLLEQGFEVARAARWIRVESAREGLRTR